MTSSPIPSIQAWPRPLFVLGGGRASVRLFVFSEGPLRDDVKLVTTRHGVPGRAAIDALELRTHTRAEAPEWFDDWRSGGLRVIASHELGEALADLDAATVVHSITLEREDPADLQHVQGAWAIARWLIDRGAQIVLDAEAGRWFRGTDVLAWPADRTFDVDRELSFVLESETIPNTPGSLMHTRGMAKFGRPDLMILGVAKDDWERARTVLRSIGQYLALGRVVQPGETTSVGPSGLIRFVELQPGSNGPEVHLNNRGLILEDADGGPGIARALAPLH